MRRRAVTREPDPCAPDRGRASATAPRPRLARLDRGVDAWVALCLLFVALRPAVARADEPTEPGPLGAPYAPLVRQHYYAQLAKSPWRALGWEALLPGAGNWYVGLHVPAAITLGVSALGAGLWVVGATAPRASGRPALLWTGVGTFAAGRVCGLVSAPIGAALLNAAFRGQLGVSGAY